MKLPLKYNLKSILQRPVRSLLTVLGVSMAISLSVIMMGLTQGLIGSTAATGDGRNVLVLSKGAETVEFSALDPQALHILGNAAGGSESLVSPEVYINSLVTIAGSEYPPTPVITRGIRDIAYTVHPQIRLSEGRAPKRGYEVAIGRLVATRLGLAESQLAIGQWLQFEGERWEITGILSAPGTAHESEIWAPLEDLMVASKRTDYSMLVMQAEDITARDEVLFDLKTRTDIRTTSYGETDYYGSEAERLKPLQTVTLMMTIMLVFGGLMAGMNTMHTSVMGRVREMAVLQVTGYRRRDVLAGFLFEGVLLSLIGGLVGCMAGLLVNGVPMKFSMSAFRFQVDGPVILAGLLLALMIGIVGTLVPVFRIARQQIAEGLRAN
jgi:putative ABC transport system permease protein